MKILALDVETGGFSPDRHALTQIALVACTISMGKATPLNQLVRSVRPAPGLLMEDSAMEIQGHTRHSLMSRPDQLGEDQIVSALKSFLGALGDGWECAPLVAHNGKFDHGFLEALCRRTGLPLPARDVLCTVERHKHLAKKSLIAKPENNKLGTLVKLIGMSQSDAHDAGQDALLCAHLFAWQEVKLAGTQSLMEETAPDAVGVVYKHEPAATDGWWTKGAGDYPAKAPETGTRLCESCGAMEATWFKGYRFGSTRNSHMGPVERFYACGPCKQAGVNIGNAIGPGSGEYIAEVGEWKYSSPETTKPPEIANPQRRGIEGGLFSCSKELVELHKRAKAGELPSLSGYMMRSGPIEDANRFVTGAFGNIQRTLEDLQRINGAVIGTEKEISN